MSYEMNPFEDSRGFFDQVSDIKNQISEYNSNIERLSQLQYNLATASSENEKQSLIKTIDLETNNNQSLLQSVKDDLEMLKRNIHKSNPDEVDQFNNLNTLLRKSIQNSSSKEYQFKETITSQAIEQYQIINPNADYREAQEFVTMQGPSDVFSKSLEMQNRKAEALEVQENVVLRHNEIMKVNQTLNDLNMMFNDLQDLVVEQDLTINQVNDNLNTASDQMERGNANTIEATHTAKKNRKCRWIIICLVVLLILIIVGIIAGLVKGLH